MRLAERTPGVHMTRDGVGRRCGGHSRGRIVWRVAVREGARHDAKYSQHSTADTACALRMCLRISAPPRFQRAAERHKQHTRHPLDTYSRVCLRWCGACREGWACAPAKHRKRLVLHAQVQRSYAHGYTNFVDLDTAGLFCPGWIAAREVLPPPRIADRRATVSDGEVTERSKSAAGRRLNRPAEVRGTPGEMPAAEKQRAGSSARGTADSLEDSRAIAMGHSLS